MKHKWFVFAFLVVTLNVALAVYAKTAGQPQYLVRLVVAHDPAPPFYLAAMQHFASDVSNKTNGRVHVQIVTSHEYGTVDQNSVRDAVAKGDIEMSASTVTCLGNLDPDLWSFEMPYLFNGYDEVEAVIDGPVGKGMLDRMKRFNLHGLAYAYSGGYKIACSNTRALRTPSDFAGLSVLTADPVNTAIFESMGARVVSGDYHNSRALIDDGTVQVADMTYTRYHEYQFRTRYVSELEHSFFLTVFIVNEPFFQKLPQQYRDAIEAAAKVAAREERMSTLREIEDIRADLERRGIQVDRLSPAQKEKFRKATAPVYARCEPLFTAGLLDRLRSKQVAGKSDPELLSTMR